MKCEWTIGTSVRITERIVAALTPSGILSLLALTNAHLMDSSEISSYQTLASSNGQDILREDLPVVVAQHPYQCEPQCRRLRLSNSPQSLPRSKNSISIFIYVDIRILTSPKTVFSIRPFTILAAVSLSGMANSAAIIGVLITFAALIISLIRGTPNVTFIEATPAKWKVFNVICVPGSPID